MNITIVEDEKKLAHSLKEGFESEGYGVSVFYDAESAEGKLSDKYSDCSLLLLDLMLPGKGGLELCRDLRSKNVNVPIIALTALNTVEDTIKALDSGVDDFVSKPFSFDELVARVRALHRRSPGIKDVEMTVADVRLDPSSRLVYRGNKAISLTMREFDILQYLMESDGKVVTREELFAHLWPKEDIGFSNVVDVHIRNLRSKIDDKYSKKIVRTVRGFGYSIQR